MLKWIGRLIGLAVLLAVLLLATGVFLYATDYGLEATVTDKDCQKSPPTVTVKTKVGGIMQTVEVDQGQCQVIQRGNFVVYNLRTERTRIYSSEGGTCHFDSASTTKICQE